MNSFLRQSTASQTKLIGPFIDDTDFVTLLTGLTIANTDIKLSKNGASSVNKNSGGATHIVNGFYAVTWDATDSNTVGELAYSVSVSGSLLVFGSYVNVEEAVYDQLYDASSPGAATVTQATNIQSDTDNIQTRLPAALVSGRMDSDVAVIQNNVITANSIASNAFTAAKFASGAFDAVWTVTVRTLTAFSFSVALTAGAIQAIWDALTSALTTSGSIGKLIVDKITGLTFTTANQVDARVLTNSDKTGYTVTDASANNVADKMLARDLQGGSSSTDRNVRNALRVLRNKVETAEVDPTTGTLTVYAEDDSTPAWTADLTKAPGDPITSVDPA